MLIFALGNLLEKSSEINRVRLLPNSYYYYYTHFLILYIESVNALFTTQYHLDHLLLAYRFY